MSKVISIAAPIVGAFFGPMGAAIGGAIGGAVNGGDFKSMATGALTGYAGSALAGGFGGATPGFNPAGGSIGGTTAAGLGTQTAGSGFDLMGMLPTDSAFVNIPGAAGAGAGGYGGSLVQGASAGFGGMTPTDSAFVNIPGATPNPSAPLGNYGGETMNFGGGVSVPSGSSGSVVAPADSQQPSFMDQAKNTFQSFSQGVSDFARPLTSKLPTLSPQVRQGLGLASAGMSLYSGFQGLQAAEELKKRAQAMQTTDAMDPYRAGYAAQLQALMSNPDSIKDSPGYKAGLTALQRSMAAQGFTGSGNAQVKIADYGSSFFDREVARLQSLASGGGQNAGTALQAQLQAAQLQGQGLASMGYGVRGLGY